MRHYCTYCDRGYLPQCLALADSIRAHDPSARIWILALDDVGAAWAPAAARGRVAIVPLPELLAADPALGGAARNRTRTEFVFTVTACWIRFVLDRAGPDDLVAYVDADLFLFSNPDPAWAELDGASAVIVPHDYPSWHDDARWYGRFNVGWLLFRNDAAARTGLESWRARCIESCAMAGDGVRFGDQKYLDEWPDLLGGALRMSDHPGVNLAPWNWAARRPRADSDGVTVAGRPLIVYHFAQLRPIEGDWWDSGQLEYGVMPARLACAIYRPYVQAIRRTAGEVSASDPTWRPLRRSWAEARGSFGLGMFRWIAGQFWEIRGDGWRAPRLLPGAMAGRLLGYYRRWQRRAS